MKFIISSLSPNMITMKDYQLIFHELTEEEFQAIAYDGYSCIGQKDIAKLTGFAYNQEAVKCRAGDVLLLANMQKKGLRFYCIQVTESPTPLFREEEEVTEEMI